MRNHLSFDFRPYARPFRHPLQTHHGEWSVRQGILLRLESEDGIGWGEIAPLDFLGRAFGGETLAQALEFCQTLPTQIPVESIWQIPESLPACRFGFESAWEQLQPQFHFSDQDGHAAKNLQVARACHQFLSKSSRTHRSTPDPANRLGAVSFTTQEVQRQLMTAPSVLLPTGTAALESPQLFSSQSPLQTTFKWKIGVAPIGAELATFEQLINLLPEGAKLRLDANGGLSWQEADTWLRLCDGYSIEYLEQPLPPDQFDLMLKLSQRHETPIALDESVATLNQLQTCYQQNWRGIFVIKAPIAGSPIQLRNFCQTHSLDVVWSSVFETPIARRYVETHLMMALPSTRATGFGVEHWFSDQWAYDSAEQLWQRLTS